MNIMPSLDASEWEAVGVWLAILAGGAVAWWQVSEGRKLRREQAEPQVVAFMEVDLGRATVELVVRNFGQTLARDVRIDSMPPLRRTSSAGRGTVEDVAIPEVIPCLAPGQEWRTWWDSPPSRMATPVLEVERRHDVRVSFTGIRRRKRLTTESVLDWGVYKGTLHEDKKTVHDAANALIDIRKAVVGWGEPRGRGLAVFVRDGDAKSVADRKRNAQSQLRLKKLQDRLLPGPPEGETHPEGKRSL